ncbi:MAG: hypothetical protein KDC35_09975 [Acidobacteria bacterium]|nr:hypothetical protein [Acidobacteriota bacterium]
MKKRILVMTSSLLTDRMLRHSSFISAISSDIDWHIWSTSCVDEDYWGELPPYITVSPFPSIRRPRDFPVTYVRRIFEYAWNQTHPSAPRRYMLKHFQLASPNFRNKVFHWTAKAVNACRVQFLLKQLAFRLYRNAFFGKEAEDALMHLKPDLVVVMNPFLFHEPAIAAIAQRSNIPSIAMIPSWDNISTKTSMVLRYHHYLVWSEQQRKELAKTYEDIPSSSSTAVGTPQYDSFFNVEHYITREAFFRQQGLDPTRKLVVYALGSPNFIREPEGLVRFVQHLTDDDHCKFQLLVRAHPIHHNADLRVELGSVLERIRIQDHPFGASAKHTRALDAQELKTWINTFRHADVIVNLASTVTLDGFFFQKPVVNIGYDPEEKGSQTELIRDICTQWPHYAQVTQSGSVWNAHSIDEAIHAVREYLTNQSLHHDQRTQLLEQACQFCDGNSGRRLAHTIAQFAEVRN